MSVFKKKFCFGIETFITLKLEKSNFFYIKFTNYFYFKILNKTLVLIIVMFSCRVWLTYNISIYVRIGCDIDY